MLSLYILLALQSSNCTTLPFLHSDVHSYLQHMGVAEAKCLSGCECSSVQMDGTWPYKLSLFTFKSFAVSRHICLLHLLWKVIRAHQHAEGTIHCAISAPEMAC